MARKSGKILPFTKDSVAKRSSGASNVDISASSGPSQPALDENRLRDVVQRILYYGEIKETFHSASERAARNVSQDDIAAMLESQWKLEGTPEWDGNHKNWKYRLAGVDLEGDSLVLVVTVNEELKRVTVITKF
ncbi:hypothetical protein BH10ACI4_BH10ACI4_13680 [soil metagenome]